MIATLRSWPTERVSSLIGAGQKRELEVSARVQYHIVTNSQPEILRSGLDEGDS